MNIELKKKSYVAPLMEVYQYQTQGNLLDCSKEPCPVVEDIGDNPSVFLEI